jgi:hypothetical protein
MAMKLLDCGPRSRPLWSQPLPTTSGTNAARLVYLLASAISLKKQ